MPSRSFLNPTPDREGLSGLGRGRPGPLCLSRTCSGSELLLFTCNLQETGSKAPYPGSRVPPGACRIRIAQVSYFFKVHRELAWGPPDMVIQK